MIDRIGRTTLLVHDQDAALAFYRDKLDFAIIADVRLPNGFRALHIGPPGQPGVGLWLMPATSPEARDRVGNQTAGEPCLVMYTTDCRAAHQTLTARGVHFPIPPVEEPRHIYAHFHDLYGNEIVLVQLLPTK